VDYLQERYGVSIRLACEVAGIRRSSYSYTHERVDDDAVADAILSLVERHPRPLAVPEQFNVCWSMDFMRAALRHGHRFHTFNVVDDFNREVLTIDVNSRITAERVVTMLERVITWRGSPDIIRVDNGSEFTSSVFAEWAEQLNIELEFIDRRW
jgi:transposase InsO family protein